MIWPEWLTEARVAIAIAALSAAFTLAGLIYTRRLVLNDTARMKRKELAVEPIITRRVGAGDAHFVRIAIRNLEPHEARLTKVEIVRGKALFRLDPKQTRGASDDVPAKTRDIKMRVLPAPQPGCETAILIITDRAVEPSDFRVRWHWLDGTKR